MKVKLTLNAEKFMNRIGDIAGFGNWVLTINPGNMSIL